MDCKDGGCIVTVGGVGFGFGLFGFLVVVARASRTRLLEWLLG
jgi:hypothetical protein